MSVDMSCSTYSSRLYFGVPLEDISPPGEVHRSLKDLMLQSYKNIIENEYDVAYVLSRLQGTLLERLKLKQRLTVSKEFPQLKVSLGTPFWVLRHFIGLLPVPLLPQYTNGSIFIWRDLAKTCKDSLANYITRGRNNNELIDKIVRELLRLPVTNFLLFATLMNLFRMMVVLPRGEPKINKTTIFPLVKYFSSSLFLRPFRPGWSTRIDKQYYPLLLYLILKWPDIRKICMENSEYSFELPLREIYPALAETTLPPEYPHYLSKRSNQNATQTDQTHDRIIDDENGTLVRIVPPSYNDFSYLKDTGCQTDSCIGETQDNLMLSKATQCQASGVETQVIFLKRDCCCMYSSNYEKYNPHSYVQRKVNISSSSDQSQSSEDVSSPRTYGWNLSDILDRKTVGPSAPSSPTSDCLDNTNYSYDNYSRFNLIGDSEDSNPVYENIKAFDPIAKVENKNHNEALKERVSKVGWTYISPIKDKADQQTIDDITPTKCLESKTEQYRLYYNEVRRSLNEELKEKLKKMRIKEESDKESSNSEDLRRSTSKLNLSENVCDSKKGIMGVGRIKSKLDFIRSFNTKKIKTRKNTSYEHMSSKVKYEKMGSISSIL